MTKEIETETVQTPKLKVKWLTEATFRAYCPVHREETTWQFYRQRDAYGCNRDGNLSHMVKDSDIMPSRAERLKAILLGTKNPPRGEPLGLQTLIYSKATHIPKDVIGTGQSVPFGTITTQETLAAVLMNLKSQSGITPEQKQFLINNFEEIRDSAEIRRFLERQKPWSDFRWDDVTKRIEFWRNDQAAQLRDNIGRKATEDALEHYWHSHPVTTPQSGLTHEKSQKVRAQIKMGEQTPERPKHFVGDHLNPGTTKLEKVEMDEHARFSKENEERLTAYYASIGWDDLNSENCVHKISSRAERVRVSISLMTPLECPSCGKSTSYEFLMTQLRLREDKRGKQA